ncbi:MAG: PEP-CTERM sorting domain-containing protein [Gemmatimonadaceae bacterium]|jgi:hypothetical protein|nr:PEP-CTERM sorting domain-containing protein [Gemmatimonadaceae bacterium]
MHRRLLSALALVALGSSPLFAQRVFVSHDEWFLNNGFNAPASNERRLLTNALDWFGVGAGDQVLTWSGNQIAYVNSPLGSVVTGRGATYTRTTGAVANLSQYKAIFVGGFAVDNTALINYVLGGGNVVLVGGTCTRLAAGASCDTNAGQEAADWQTFLQRFGMGFSSQYNGLATVNTSGFAAQGPFGAALFTGVGAVYADNGNSVLTTITPPTGVVRQIFNAPSGPGVFGAAVVIPEPSTYALLGTGLMVLVGVARRRRRQ